MSNIVDQLHDALRECYSVLQDSNQLLLPYADINEDAKENIRRLHQEALAAADKAMTARDHYQRLCLGAQEPLKIKAWIASGQVDECATTEWLYDQAGNLLDDACSHEILGEILFVGEDDVIYTMTVEACLGEANPEYLKDRMQQEQQPTKGNHGEKE